MRQIKYLFPGQHVRPDSGNTMGIFDFLAHFLGIQCQESKQNPF